MRATVRHTLPARWKRARRLRYLDAMRELLVAVGATPQIQLLDSLYEEQRATREKVAQHETDKLEPRRAANTGTTPAMARCLRTPSRCTRSTVFRCRICREPRAR